MSGMNKSAYAGRRIGLLTMAIGLLTGGIAQAGGVQADKAIAQGNAMMAAVKYHHRGIMHSRPSGAAAAKRASAKRRNVLKRQSNRR
jgi:hypothetical protein